MESPSPALGRERREGWEGRGREGWEGRGRVRWDGSEQNHRLIIFN